MKRALLLLVCFRTVLGLSGQEVTVLMDTENTFTDVKVSLQTKASKVYTISIPSADDGQVKIAFSQHKYSWTSLPLSGKTKIEYRAVTSDGQYLMANGSNEIKASGKPKVTKNKAYLILKNFPYWWNNELEDYPRIWFDYRVTADSWDKGVVLKPSLEYFNKTFNVRKFRPEGTLESFAAGKYAILFNSNFYRTAEVKPTGYVDDFEAGHFYEAMLDKVRESGSYLLHYVEIPATSE